MIYLGIALFAVAWFFLGVGAGRWSMRQDIEREMRENDRA